MAQFTSYPAARPQPFAIYNNQRSTLMSELGEALTALGNIPQQMQQNQIKNELNKLLLTSLTAPRTETQTTLDPNKFVGGFYDEGDGSVGSYLTEKEIPGKKYAEATGRLEDVGFADAGFSFRPKAGQRPLADLLELERFKGDVRKEVEGTKTTGRLTTQEQAHKNAMEKQAELIKGNAQNQLLHDDRIAKIRAQTDKSKEQIAKEELAERKRWHDIQDKNMVELNKIRRSVAGSREDIQTVNSIEKLTNEMRNQDTQINNILKLEGQSSPNTVGLLRDAISRYNNLRNELIKLDPNYSEFPEKRLEDIPWYSDPSQLLPGRVPPQRLQPGLTPGQTTNPSPPTAPRRTPPPRNPAGTPETLPQTTPQVDVPLTAEEIRKRRERILQNLNKPQY